jgi:hypothetical protein
MRHEADRRTVSEEAVSVAFQNPHLFDHVREVAIVFSLMVDGSGSRACRIFGWLRPARIVRKRGTMTHQSASCSGK